MKAVFLALLLLIPTSSQVWAQNGPYYASEEEACEANNVYDEILYIQHFANVYDSVEGSRLAEEKRVILGRVLSFYDRQLKTVDQWINEGKCKGRFEGMVFYDMHLDLYDLKGYLLKKTSVLEKYEKDLPDDVKEILHDNDLHENDISRKLKAGKKYLPVAISLRERLSKERDSIANVINKEDSVVILFKVTEDSCIGLWEAHYSSSFIKSELPTERKLAPVPYKNPNYIPAEGKWAWLYRDDREEIKVSYPKEEKYIKYASHPEYKVKKIKDRYVVFLDDNVLYIQNDETSKSELIRQVCIQDYKNNKYDIMSTSPSLRAKIDKMLIEGKDREYYKWAELAYKMVKQAYNTYDTFDNMASGNYGLAGVLTLPLIPHTDASPSAAEKAQFEDSLKAIGSELENAKLMMNSDPEYQTAEKYITQLKSDRDSLTFTSKRIDDFSYLYVSSDGKFRIKKSMSVEGEKIKDTYSLVTQE